MGFNGSCKPLFHHLVSSGYFRSLCLGSFPRTAHTHKSIIQDRGLRRVNEKIHCKALTADSGTRKMPYIDICVSFALVVFNL